MTVLVVERVSVALRGELSRWMLELKAGVYVGLIAAPVRDRIWRLACSRVEDGAAVMVEAADTEQGYRFRLWGLPRNRPGDFEGVVLLRKG